MDSDADKTHSPTRIPVPWVFVIAYMVGIGIQFVIPVSIGSAVWLAITQALGVVMLAAGSILPVWAQWIFRKAYTTTVPYETTTKFVDWGPYRFTRNPMSLYERVGHQPAHGIGPLGFRRLLWHDLVLAAYLDLLGLIPAERKKVEAVFYDARDIEFQDVGVSPRMLDAIVEYARISGARASSQVPERLSDMLGWLARSGFEVSLCVDKNRLNERGVVEFVRRLQQGGCRVVSKDLAGLMHKKAVTSPLGAIEGSANLTYGGMGGNEEIISYAPWGTSGYMEIQTSVRDTFHGTSTVTSGD